MLQSLQFCAVHALNNLFQGKEIFSKDQLNQISKELAPDAWWNPHRSPLGFGNYDINVIQVALHQRKYAAIWYDRRKDPCCLELSKILGFILNIPSRWNIGPISLPITGKHWVVVRRREDDPSSPFVLLDSKVPAPTDIGDVSRCFLRCT
ncbi:unnamed protein product, partial [Cyprideis torosa]